jgi:hypothetical protein
LLYKQYEEILFEVSAQYMPGGKESRILPFLEKTKKQGLIIVTG